MASLLNVVPDPNSVPRKDGFSALKCFAVFICLISEENILQYTEDVHQ
jgi:hypothetical protein